MFFYILFSCFILTVFAFIKANRNEPYFIKYPKTWPKPNYDFNKNPLTKEGVKLGRQLFYEPMLSADNTISCSSCHLSYSAFTHVDHALSHGIYDSIGTRNSSALMNLAWNKSFMWDGAINHIDFQALSPIENPLEMGEKLSNIVSKLKEETVYKDLFFKAFGDSTITGQLILKALAQFQLTLISSNSKYDKIMRKEPGVAFTEQEANGYSLFKLNCANCHKEPLFTSFNFANNGLEINPELKDYGLMKITQKPSDSLHFKIPTLRNIEYTYPYMHDGRFKKLADVIDHYVNDIQSSNTLSEELTKPILLTSNQKVDLIAFLLTLSDREFIFNPAFAYPRKMHKK